MLDSEGGNRTEVRPLALLCRSFLAGEGREGRQVALSEGFALQVDGRKWKLD